MPTVHIDSIDTLTLQEKWGVVESVVRRAIVSGLTGTDWSTMYDVLDAAGVPAYGDYLDTSRGAHLRVASRDVQMVDRDIAEITITYQTFNDQGQSLHNNRGALIASRKVTGKMSASIVQKTTNMYSEDGQGDKDTITLEHTYPTDDPDYGGKTVRQTGEVNVHIPQRTITIAGDKETAHPWDIADNLIGCVNAESWLGREKHTWMCTEVTWDLRNEDHYFMSFTFQHDSDTWNPTAVFVDDRTNRPPADLVKDIGYKYIRYHRERNFIRELGFRIVGPVQ